jgi:hypothetical protein
MKTMQRIGLAILTSGGLMLTGCDDARTADPIEMDPASVEVTGAGSVVLRAMAPETDGAGEALYMPLEWSVYNRSLGGVMSSAGHTAIYESNGKVGRNVVFVKDQSGREGIVAINQVRAP